MASLTPVAGALGKKAAAHLLRRTTFGPTRAQIDQFAGYTADDALTQIYQPVTPPAVPPWLTYVREDVNQGDRIAQWKIWSYNLMIGGGTSGIEKLVFFLHTHLTTIQSVVDLHSALYFQNTLFRYYALGNIKDLTKKICIDNAMLILLDGRINVNGNPNENFARELLELYSIGKGPQIGPGDYTNYTEEDIKQAAKVLSGWEVDITFQTLDEDTQIPMGVLKDVGRHDFSNKTFSNAFQNKVISPVGGVQNREAAWSEIDQLIEMIFAQTETAKNICRKIYRFFLYYQITEEVEQDIITPLANTLIANNYQLLPVFQQFFKSQHFYDLDTVADRTDDNRSAIIKSPLEVVFGTLRFFEVAVPSADALNLSEVLFQQGLDLYEPYDVAGYDAYHQYPDFNRNWISNNHLARRYEFGSLIVRGEDSYGNDLGCKLDIVGWVKKVGNISDPFSDEIIVKELIDYFLPEELTPERFDYFFKIFTEELPSSNWTMEWNKYINTGNDVAVRQQLNKLVVALLNAPESQLF